MRVACNIVCLTCMLLTPSIRLTVTPIILPDISFNPESDLQPHSVTVSAHVDPVGGGAVSDVGFHGSNISYGQSAQCLDSDGNPVGTPDNPLTTATDVHAELVGLEVLMTYNYRLIAIPTPLDLTSAWIRH